MRITAHLGGKTADELAEVALFAVEYGPTMRYGKRLDFYDWPEPGNPKLLAKRDYSVYSRFCSRVIRGLSKGKRYYFRVIARDLAGNETRGRRGRFIFRPGRK